MATAYRSSQSVTNATAGTSVTVSKPPGIVDTGAIPGRDELVGFIATVGAPTITAPAGWTLITSVAASTSVTIAAYRKRASSEGASWTWTLGASQRNWGWVGAYTGVDPDNPITDFDVENSLTASVTLMPTTPIKSHGQGVSGAAAVRAASGMATTWTHSSTERSDLSTNAGAGTDITGVVGDTAYGADVDNFYGPSMTASQTQTAGVAIAVTLKPYFIPYGGGRLDVVLEAAFGVDPDSDQETWPWTSVTDLLHQPDSDAAVTIKYGRPSSTSTGDPATITFTLLNLNGEWTHPEGAYWADMVLYLPFRVRLAGIGVTTYHRGTAYLQSAKPRWDASLNFSVVDVICRGRLWRLRQDEQTLHSAAYRSIQHVDASFTTLQIPPIAYWPFEDKSGASGASSAIADVAPLSPADVDFGGDSSFTGSDGAARLTDTSMITASVPAYTVTGQWSVVWGCMIPSEPAADTVLLNAFQPNPNLTWRVTLVPGTTALKIEAINSVGSILLTNSMGITEDFFYGQPSQYTLTTTSNGGNIDYWLSTIVGGMTGTLASVAHGNLSQVTVGPSPGLNGAGFCHLAVYVDPAIEGSLIGSSLATALINAHLGEWPWVRFQRLCSEERVPYTVDASTDQDLSMGPQQVATLSTLLADCEAVEGVAMHDAGTDILFIDGVIGNETGLLKFPARDTRDNKTTDLTLTMLPGSGHVSPGFEPVLDDVGTFNSVEVRRNGGGSVTATNAASAAKGLHVRTITVNTRNDSRLADIAGIRLQEAADRGYRYTRAQINLRNPHTLALAKDWLALGIGSKVVIENPPRQYAPDDIESFTEGIEEQLGSHHWVGVVNLSPGGNNRVAVLANDVGDTGAYIGHLDWDTCVLAEDLTTTETAVDVTATPLITTNADDFPLDVYVGGEQMTVTTVAAPASPTFQTGVADHDDNASVTPALPASVVAGDVLFLLAAIRNSGAGTVNDVTGYTRLLDMGNAALFGRVAGANETVPTVSFAAGAAGATTSARIVRFRDLHVTNIASAVIATNSTLNASGQDIIYPALNIDLDHCLVLIGGWKQDDWTSVATLSGASEVFDEPTTVGNDQGLVLDRIIQTTAAGIPSGSFTVTGGAAAISRGFIIALHDDTQTLTVVRSGNTVVKTHLFGAAVQLHPNSAFWLGM